MPQREISVDNILLSKLEDDSQHSQPNVSNRSQSFSSIGYINQPLPQQHQHTSQKPQYSYIDESISPIGKKAIEPIGISNTLTSHQVIKTLPTFSSYRQNTVEASIYDANNIFTDEIKPEPRQSISIEKNFDESRNNKTVWNEDNDEYLQKRDHGDYNILPRVELTDSIQSVNSPCLTDVDDVSNLGKRSPPKDPSSFSFDNDIQHITQTVKPSIPNDEMPKEDRYQYVGMSDNAYYGKSPSISTQQVTNARETRNHFSLPSDDHEKPIKFGDKRRSSFDSGSLAKSTADDSELRKKSIVPNVRRRYSVAANLYDLQKNVSNIEPFQLQSLSSINYRGDGNTFDMKRNSFDTEPSNTTKSDIVSTLTSGQINKRNSMDSGPAVKIEDIVESEQVIDYSDQQIPSANVLHSQQQPVEVVHDSDYGRDVNHTSDINSYYVTDNNAPYSTYETNDETFVETAMENLHLDNSTMEQQPSNELQLKQFNDEADKIRLPTTHRYIFFSSKNDINKLFSV